jgi:hypothetical protein
VGEGVEQLPYLIPSLSRAESEMGDDHTHDLARDFEFCVDGSTWFSAWDAEIMQPALHSSTNSPGTRGRSGSRIVLSGISWSRHVGTSACNGSRVRPLPWRLSTVAISDCLAPSVAATSCGGYPEMFSQQPVAKAGDRLLKDGRSGGLYGDIAFRIETHRTVGDVG